MGLIMSVLDDFKDIENQQNKDIKQEIISEIYAMYMPLIDQLNQKINQLQDRIDILECMEVSNRNNIARINGMLTTRISDVGVSEDLWRGIAQGNEVLYARR